MKRSSNKTWRTSHLILKPLRTQTLKEKSGGNLAYYVPPRVKKWGARPPCPPPNCAHAFRESILQTTLQQLACCKWSPLQIAVAYPSKCHVYWKSLSNTSSGLTRTNLHPISRLRTTVLNWHYTIDSEAWMAHKASKMVPKIIKNQCAMCATFSMISPFHSLSSLRSQNIE